MSRIGENSETAGVTPAGTLAQPTVSRVPEDYERRRKASPTPTMTATTATTIHGWSSTP
jgi:hypothetical protein